MGRNPAYNSNALIEVVHELLPDGAVGWSSVATHYKEHSGESELRNPDDIKRYWIQTLCNKMNKPTGKSGDASDRILRCQRIQREILEKNSSFTIDSDDEEGEFDDLEDEEESFVMKNESENEDDMNIPEMPSLPKAVTPNVNRNVPSEKKEVKFATIPTTSAATKKLSSIAPVVGAPVAPPKTKNCSVHGKRGNVLSSIDKLTACISNDDKTSDSRNDRNDMMMIMMMNTLTNKNNTNVVNNSNSDHDHRLLTLERQVQTQQFELDSLERKLKRFKEDTEDEINRLKKKNDL